LDGEYSITATKGNTIVFSFIGYIEESVIVADATTIDIQLAADIEQLEEVVVVGYGTMNKSDLTGSVTSVSVDNTTESGATSVNELLQGRAAGVNVKTNSGVPGGSVSINIRGVGSMSASTQPLYVIDGVLMPTGGGDEPDNDVTVANPMGFLSPDDIESIEILKDASATAIYGSRGANGVVLVTTKKGKKGTAVVEYTGSFSISRVGKKIEMLDGPGFAHYRNEIDTIGLDQPDSTYIYDGRNAAHPLPDSVEWIDWQDEMYQNAVSQRHRISISGATEESSYFTSLGYLGADGIIESTGLRKFDFRSNFTKDVTEKFSYGVNVSGSLLENDMTVGTDNFGGDKSMVGSIIYSNPIIGDYVDSTGVLDPDMLEENNPYAWRDGHSDKATETTLISKFNLDYQILPSLKFQTRLGVNYRAKERNRYWGRGTYRGAQDLGRANQYLNSNFHYVFDNLLFHNAKVGKHRFNSTLGVSYDHRLLRSYRYNAQKFIDDFTMGDAMHGGADQSIVNTHRYPTTYASGLFRINYGYANTLSVTVTGRADGSSKFQEGNQWGFFPSAAVAYKLHNEDFMSSFDVLSNLKLRVGWGQVGNSSSKNYSTISQFHYEIGSDDQGLPVGTLVPTELGNTELTWETSQQTNLGIDFGFWRNRLTFTLEAYYKTTVDQLQNISLPNSAGFENIWVNLGKVENKGFEFDLNSVIVDNSDWRFTLGGNFAINRNKILELGRTPDEYGQVFYMGGQVGFNDEVKAPINVFMEGQPVGAFFGYVTDGIIQDAEDAANQPLFSGNQVEEGNIKFVNIRDRVTDTIPMITPDDRTIIGDPNPDFTAGLYSSLSYKGFSLSFQLTGVYGRDVFNANKARSEDHSKTGSNKLAESYYQAWRPDAPSNTYPRLDFDEATWGPNFTDRWIEDASYIRMNYITLAYDFNVKTVANIRALKLYSTINNLFTITNYSGYDPEVDSFSWDPSRPGIDFNSFPSIQTIVFGINVTFE
jgi:TonB-linked SusC/RagA family outer membrane protein